MEHDDGASLSIGKSRWNHNLHKITAIESHFKWLCIQSLWPLQSSHYDIARENKTGHKRSATIIARSAFIKSVARNLCIDGLILFRVSKWNSFSIAWHSKWAILRKHNESIGCWGPLSTYLPEIFTDKVEQNVSRIRWNANFSSDTTLINDGRLLWDTFLVRKWP